MHQNGDARKGMAGKSPDCQNGGCLNDGYSGTANVLAGSCGVSSVHMERMGNN